MLNVKRIGFIAGAVLTIILAIFLNPFGYNEGGNRTVVQRMNGDQFVVFTSGTFYGGFFSKEFEWPNQISVSYQDSIPDFDLKDNGIDVGWMEVMFSDKITAKMKGITQFVLPSTESEMLLVHNTHRSPESLVRKRLAPYAKECIQSAAQQMTADMHSSGGRAQMSQDYNQQLREGVVLLNTKERVVYDSIDKENKRIFENIVQVDKSGFPKRKISSVKEYGITIADAQITDVQYDPKFTDRRNQLIDAATKTAVSKSDLVVAQQQTLTEKAKGEKALVTVEYEQKKNQTQQVVESETRIKVAEADKMQQKIAYEGAQYEGKKIKELADAKAYEKAKLIQADGALDAKLKAYMQVNEYWAEAFGKYGGNVVPTYSWGGASGGGNAAQNFMEIMTMKSAKDLNLSLTNK